MHHYILFLVVSDETKPVSDKGNADKSSQETEEELIQKGTEEPANDPGLTSTTSENPTTDSGVEQDGDGEKPKRPKDKSCLFGILGECQENEECFLNSNRKRLGVCVCVNGTKLNKETGWCEKITRNSKYMYELDDILIDPSCYNGFSFGSVKTLSHSDS